MKFGFSIYRSGERLQSYEMVRNPLVVGRSDGCDLVLDSRTVSRRHCELKLKRQGLTIKDLGSRNGTMVNDQAIEPDTRVLISVGDSIQIGKFTLQVEDVTENADKATPIAPKVSALEQEDLLASLEEFIRDRTVHDGRVANEKITQVQRENPGIVVPWTATKPVPDLEETVHDTRNEETRLLEDSSSSGESSSSGDKVSLSATVDSLEDEAELRRLDLRKRLEAMKAKDSKEAADRALKKLFGG